MPVPPRNVAGFVVKTPHCCQRSFDYARNMDVPVVDRGRCVVQDDLGHSGGAPWGNLMSLGSVDADPNRPIRSPKPTGRG